MQNIPIVYNTTVGDSSIWPTKYACYVDVFRKGKAYSTVYPTSNPSVTITNLIPEAQVISIEAGEMGISDSHSNKIGKIKELMTEPLKLKKKKQH